jgi:DNA-directed RNA polymerase alpha subunit
MNLTITVDNVEQADQIIEILSRYTRFEQADLSPAPAEQAGSRTPITDLELGRRACNVLRRAGIETIEELLCYTRWELRRMPNVGVHTVDEITEVLSDRGLSLGQPYRRILIPT